MKKFPPTSTQRVSVTKCFTFGVAGTPQNAPTNNVTSTYLKQIGSSEIDMKEPKSREVDLCRVFCIGILETCLVQS